MSWVTQGQQQKSCKSFHIRDCYPLGSSFPACSVNFTICNSSHFRRNDIVALQPPTPPLLSDKSASKGEVRFGLIPFRSPLLREFLLVSFPLGTEMFHFPRYTLQHQVLKWLTKSAGFPHSEISGSKVASHLTGAYRRQATSFIAFFSLGIHHTLLDLLLGNLKTAYVHSPWVFINECTFRRILNAKTQRKNLYFCFTCGLLTK